VLDVFVGWREEHDAALRGLDRGSDPKPLITDLSENLLARFGGEVLVSHYDVYQHLMDYWAEDMQVDVYAIAQEGWKVGRGMRPAYEKAAPDLVVKKGNKTTRYVGELIPASLVIARFFKEEQAEVDRLAGEAEAAAQAKAEFEEEHGGEDGVLFGLEGKNGIPKGNVQNRVMELREEALETVPVYTPEYEQAREIKRASFGTVPWEKGMQDDGDIFAELDVLYDYLRLVDAEAQAKKAHKEAADALDRTVLGKYPELTEEEIKALVVDDKWIAAIERAVRAEVERVAQTVAGRVKVLEERYAEPLPILTPRDGNPIGTAIAEGTAIILAHDLESRKRLKIPHSM
jgi:type I restriction enzyme M protein